MSPADALARRRWLVIQLARFSGFAGAILGLLLVVRSQGIVPRIIGIALVLSALLLIATVPAALAHRWRSPE